MEAFETLTAWMALAAEAIAVAMIGFAMLEAVIRLIPTIARAAPGQATHRVRDEIRLHFGRWLVLALEFLLAADIMRTAVAPSWTEIGQLAAIAVLRTALNYFLQKEMERAAAREERATDEPPRIS